MNMIYKDDKMISFAICYLRIISGILCLIIAAFMAANIWIICSGGLSENETITMSYNGLAFYSTLYDPYLYLIFALLTYFFAIIFLSLFALKKIIIQMIIVYVLISLFYLYLVFINFNLVNAIWCLVIFSSIFILFWLKIKKILD